MKTKTLFPLLLIITLFYSCTDNNPLLPDENKIVITAYLVADKPVDNIYITTLAPFNNPNSQQPVSDAKVVLFKNGVPYNIVAHTEKSGYYYYPNNDLTVTAGDSFMLSVSYNNTIATAETIVPDKPKITFVSRDTVWLNVSDYNANPDSGLVTFNWETPGSSNKHYIFNIDIFELFYSFYSYDIDLETTTVEKYWSRQTKTLNKYNFYNNQDGPIVFNVYSINREYIDFFNSIFLIDGKTQEISTNIKNGYGIFTAFNSDSYTIYLVRIEE